MVASEVSLETYVVPLSLGGESLVVLHLLVWVYIFASVILDVLDLLVELIFKHTHRINWMLKHIVGELWFELAQFIDRHIESGT